MALQAASMRRAERGIQLKNQLGTVCKKYANKQITKWQREGEKKKAMKYVLEV